MSLTCSPKHNCNSLVTNIIAMKKWIVIIVGSVLAGALLLACTKAKTSGNTEEAVDPSGLILGQFNADSAYSFIEQQLAFGSRVPGSDGHRACRNYLIDKLKSYNADSMVVQDAVLTAYNGDKLPITNIIAGWNVDVPRRVLLVAHWDSRPWSDKETDADKRMTPVPGANDGASGVAVLLEIARNMALRLPDVGVDIMFTDAEDYGDSSESDDNEDTWCLGTQYWIKSGMPPFSSDNLPVYGILLDMVGGRNARFHYEYFSQLNAPNPTVKVWSEASRIGHGSKFIRQVASAVTDDHIFLSRAGIPTTNIIEGFNEETLSFAPTWHTNNDNIENIDRNSLKAVGETVLNVIYKEKQ